MVKFDHIIHYVNKLDEHGAVLPMHSGGRHERFGTANMLSYFDQRYVEYLAIDDERKFNRHLEEAVDSFARTIDDAGYEEGFLRYALSTENIAQLSERYRAKGFEILGPLDMERTTAGETIRWKLLYVLDEAEVFPFFIQWEEPEPDRLERIRGLRGALVSPEMNIHHEVRNLKRWEAFFDVIGIWEGRVDDHTVITLKENEKPSITLELGMDGESAIYKGAVYKFI